ncbi:MAG: hypothetical protein EPN91_02315 [Salinibacterium sp.]|nr:MAG: hypothetical protein EPN91_02315 [Salinibacterium sp.]
MIIKEGRMEAKTKATAAAGLGAAVGLGVLTAVLRTQTPVTTKSLEEAIVTPGAATSYTPPAEPTTRLGFARSTLTAIPAVSSSLVLTKFEPVAQSSVPIGSGNIAISSTKNVLIAQKAYGFDVWSLAPAPSFKFGIKSPYPPNGDGQETVTRVAMSQDGERIIAATHRTTHGVLVYDSKWQLRGEFGAPWTGVKGVVEVDQPSPGKYVGYSISVAGAYRADLTTLGAAGGSYVSSRLTVPVNSSMPSSSGITLGGLWYSTGALLVRVDLQAQTFVTFDSNALGLQSLSQLVGVVAVGDHVMVEATSTDGVSRGVALLAINGTALTPLVVWLPPAGLRGFVGAPGISPNGIPYVWEKRQADGAAVLFENWLQATTGDAGIAPSQTLVTAAAIYVASPAGTWWGSLGFAPPEPTRPPTPVPTVPAVPTATPTAVPTAAPPGATPTAMAWQALCAQDAFTACLAGGIAVTATIDGKAATLNLKASSRIVAVWDLGSDLAEVSVKYDSLENRVKASGPGAGRATVKVAGRPLPVDGQWMKL